MSDYIRLGFGSDPEEPTKWINCMRTTADFYGWTAVCPRWHGINTQKGERYVMRDTSGGRGNAARGGRRLRICRSASREGWPRGATNCFRVSTRATKKDLAWLAAHTTQPFAWMQAPSGRRLTEPEWLALAVGAGFAAAN